MNRGKWLEKKMWALEPLHDACPDYFCLEYFTVQYENSRTAVFT